MVQKLDPGSGIRMIVGLTGGYGSGKSTVSGIFEKLGAFVVSADKLAQLALEPGAEAHANVKNVFPGTVNAENGRVDRAKLAAVVFKDEDKRKQLESWIHPFVFEKINEAISKAKNNMIVIEMPLLFETCFDQECDRTVTVTAPKKAIAERLGKKGIAAEEIALRNAAQMLQIEKEKLADFIIDNSGPVEETEKQVKEILDKLKKDSKGVL